MSTIVQTRNVFITHGWKHSDHILKLQEELDRGSEFDEEFAYVNHGNFDPTSLLQDDVDSLNVEVRNQMNKADVVLLPVDLYEDHKEWVDKELKLAIDMELPVVLIRSFKNTETPPHLEEKADEVVVFDPEEILKAVKNYG